MWSELCESQYVEVRRGRGRESSRRYLERREDQEFRRLKDEREVVEVVEVVVDIDSVSGTVAILTSSRSPLNASPGGMSKIFVAAKPSGVGSRISQDCPFRG